MGSHGSKLLLFEEFARTGRALASPLRVLILDLLAQGEHNVEQIAAEIGARVGNTSAQLQVLRGAGLVACRRDGARVIYRLSGDDVLELIVRAREVAHAHLGDADRAARAYLGEIDELEPVDREELLERLARGDVVLLDVRPAHEFASGHIPGALSLPLDQLDQRIAELPRALMTIAYCRGRYCVFAPEAARRLRAAGIPARVLREGIVEWRVAGMPLQNGAMAGAHR